MNILRVRREDGTWEAITAIQGEPGKTPIKGVDYFDGKPGEDGFSPSADVLQTESGATITITDKTGTTTAVINNGKPGAKGPEGPAGKTPIKGVDYFDGKDGLNGKDGATFIPNVSTEGEISWTNDKDLVNPTPVNIQGKPGKDGVNGSNGEDGFSPIASIQQTDNGATITITDKTGTTTATLTNGKPGKDGVQGPQGPAGPKGETPVRGIDYWTEADKQEIINNVLDNLTPAEGGSF